MREIKFRAWDGQQMHYNVVVVDGIGYKRGSIGMIYAYGARAGIPMQYTGTKDKNGQEIYEGDIVKARDVKVNGQDKFYICEVKWMPTGWYAMSYKDLAGTEHYLGLNILETEVIGNIYENPELLEGEE